jgi:hypothetical protein
MEHTQTTNEVILNQSNARAEDGLPIDRWSALYEGVVIPIASLFAIFLFMVGVMLFSR